MAAGIAAAYASGVYALVLAAGYRQRAYLAAVLTTLGVQAVNIGLSVALLFLATQFHVIDDSAPWSSHDELAVGNVWVLACFIGLLWGWCINEPLAFLVMTVFAKQQPQQVMAQKYEPESTPSADDNVIVITHTAAA